VTLAPSEPDLRPRSVDDGAPGGSPVSATTNSWRERLRRSAWPIAILVMLLLAVSVTVLANGRGNGQPLDPDGVSPDGSRALAQVLRSHGVEVQVERTSTAFVESVATHPSATVLVSRTDLLSPDDINQLVTRVRFGGHDLVLVAPSPAQLDRLAPGVRIADAVDRRVAAPDCADPAATRAGPADAGGFTYVADPGVPTATCYDADGHPSYLVRGSGPSTTIVGQPSLLTNDRLAKQGNASLVLGALGGTGDLVWYAPSGAAVVAQQHSLRSVLPGWVGWVTLQLLVVVGVCMVWRGRRLGRLVPEPLPVIVRAVETTEGRARMYRRARAHGRAAAQLREAELNRLRDHLGLARTAPAQDVVAVAATRTGIPGAELARLLLGPPPQDDAGLLRLAQILDQLDREVRRP
jgi:Domain of unknown function (DUF4350)